MKKGKKTKIIISVAVILAIAVAAFATYYVTNQKSEEEKQTLRNEPNTMDNTPIVYATGDKLYYYDYENNQGIMIDDDIDGLADHQYIYSHTNISSDGKYIYYPDNADSTDTHSITYADLCRRSCTNPSEQPLVIDSYVSWFDVYDEAGYVLYIKNERLNEYNISTGETVDVGSSTYSHRLKSISENEYAFVDNTGALFIKEFGEEAELIEFDVGDFLWNEDVGRLYFYKNTEKTIPWVDYVDCDITEWTQETKDLYAEIQNGYYISYDGEIYEYDNGEVKLLTDSGYYYDNNGNGDYYCVYDFDFDKKIKLSEIEYSNDVSHFINANRKSVFYILTENGIVEFNPDSPASSLCIREDIGELMYIDVGSPYECCSTIIGDLYKASFDGKNFSEPSLIDCDVDYAYYGPDGECIYEKYLDGYTGSFFVDGKHITDNANDFEVRNGIITYRKYIEGQDYDPRLPSSAMVFANGMESEIAYGSITSLSFLKDGTVLYSVETESGKYENWLYKDDTNEKLICDHCDLRYTYDGYFTVTYLNEGSLYIIRDGQRVKLAENVDQYWGVY